MSALTIGTVTSQLRNISKANKQDSFLTDLELYLLFKKNAALLMRRLDEKGKLVKFSSVFETLDYVELCDIDKVEASSCGLAPKSYNRIKRTKLQMPMFTEGEYGPMVNSVTSLDGSVIFKMIRNSDIYNMLASDKNFRYNKWKYCWFLNDHLYLPDIDFPAIRVEGIFEDDISIFKCCYEDKCKRRQDQSLNIPDALWHDISQMCLKDLGVQISTPSDRSNDNQSPLK